MTSEEFTRSLSAEQSAALNVLLVEQRDAINAMRDDASAQLTEILAAKDAEIAAATSKLAHLDTIKAAIADESKDEAATLAAIMATVEESKLTDLDRKILEITKARDELNAQLAELTGTGK